MLCVCCHKHILRDAAPGYYFARNGQKVSHLLFMDDLKLCANDEKSLESLIPIVCVFSNDIVMEFGVKNVQYGQ